MTRIDIKASNAEILRLFPSLDNYYFIPINILLGKFTSGAELYKVSEEHWVIKSTKKNGNDLEKALYEFLAKAKDGDRRI